LKRGTAVVESYETEEEQQKRLWRESAAKRESDERRAKELLDERRVTHLLGEVRLQLASKPPNCMVEIFKTGWFSQREKVIRRIPAWYVGSVQVESGDRWGGGRWEFFAIGEDGRIYWSDDPVGERREFRSDRDDVEFHGSTGLRYRLNLAAVESRLRNLLDHLPSEPNPLE
jgi:hypothetical protein